MKYELDMNNIPEHIGIIMDGNGRFAKQQGLSRSEGHKAGAEKLVEISNYCTTLGIKYLTVYAFSTENWRRPQEEVKGIMKLLRSYLTDWKKYFGGKHSRMNVIGDVTALETGLQNLIKYVAVQTKDEVKHTINFAICYGGRAEIVNAAKTIALRVKKGELDISDINEEMFGDYLYTRGFPDPDLIIRPGGELRLSNFLTWQSAYSELWFSDKLWPEFTTDDLDKAIYDYQNRHRRFGGL